MSQLSSRHPPVILDSTRKADAFRERFAKVLNAALDRHDDVPMGHGRLSAAAALFGVSTNTAHGWLQGRALPEIWRIPEIAKVLNASIDELISGATAPAFPIDESHAALELHDQSGTEDSYGIYLPPETLEQTPIRSGCKLMRIQNNDMSGYVGVGDLVIYDPHIRRIGLGGAIYVFKFNGSLLVRRASKNLQGAIRVSCDSLPSADDLMQLDDFSPDENVVGKITIVGRVIGRINLQP